MCARCAVPYKHRRHNNNTADKGNGVVVMDNRDYIQEAKFSDKKFCVKLDSGLSHLENHLLAASNK